MVYSFDEKLGTGTGEYGYTCECLYKGATSCQVAVEDKIKVTAVFPVGYLLQLEYTLYSTYQGSVNNAITKICPNVARCSQVDRTQFKANKIVTISFVIFVQPGMT